MHARMVLNLGIIFFVSIFPLVSANFACGEVENNDSSLSLGWTKVSIYYADSPTKTTSCEVSPANNRFCCDPTAINGVSWAVGKTVVATVFDSEQSFFSDSVNLTISGNGYDLFEKLFLRKAIHVDNPSTSFSSAATFNVSLQPPFTALTFSLHSSTYSLNQSICTNCTTAHFTLENLTVGVYELILDAFDGQRHMYETLSFTILGNATFHRTFSCGECSGEYIRGGEVVNITIWATLPGQMEGSLYDTFPLDWLFVGEGNVSIYSQTHGRVHWNVNGSLIARSYTLQAPRSFFPRRYTFTSGFESFESKQEHVIVSRFFRVPFLFLPQRYNVTALEPSAVSKAAFVTPSQPIVLFPPNNSIVSYALFYSTRNQSGAYASYFSDTPHHYSGAHTHFGLETNLKHLKRITLVLHTLQNSSLAPKPKLYHSTTGWQWRLVSLQEASSGEGYRDYVANVTETGFFAVA